MTELTDPRPIGSLGHRLETATGADRADILRLARLFHAEDGHPLNARGEAAIEHLLLDRIFGTILKLVIDGTIVGYTVVSFGYSIEWGGRDAFIDDLYIAGNQRGAGLGRLVIENVVDWLRSMAIGALHLEVMAGNPAEKLYRRMGFSDRDSVFMSMRLI